MSTQKKILLTFIIALQLFGFLAATATTARAQGTWYNQSFQEWHAKVYDNNNPSEIFGERYTAAQVQWVIYGLFSFIISSTQNQDLVSCLFTGDIKSCADKINNIIAPSAQQSQTMIREYSQKGLLANIFEDREPSAFTYFKDKIVNFEIVPTVKAQAPGFGFEGLGVIRDIWVVTRNMSFALFVVVTIAIAFMIMFRMKISPQTTISIQSALPKLVVAIILVTFSYAIAGLLVDLMYLIIGIFSVIMSAGFAGTTTVVGTNLLNPSHMFFLMTKGPLGLGILGTMIIYFFSFVAIFALAFFGGGGLLGLAVTSAFALAFAPVFIFVAIIMLIAIIIILFWVWLKTLYTLLKAFVSVLLLTVFAPFFFLLGVVTPGFGFRSWLRSYLSNLAVFPTTGVLIAFSFFFLAQAWNLVWVDFFRLGIISEEGLGAIDNLIGDLIFGIPIAGPATLNTGWPPLLAGGERVFPLLFTGISFVTIMIVPKSAEIVQGLITGKFAIGEPFGEFARSLPGQIAIGQAGYRIGAEAQARAGQTVPGSWQEKVLRGFESWARRSKFIP